jgi:hypothetical protein
MSRIFEKLTKKFSIFLNTQFLAKKITFHSKILSNQSTMINTEINKSLTSKKKNQNTPKTHITFTRKPKKKSLKHLAIIVKRIQK